MKKITLYIFNLAVMLGGLSLSLWGLFMWTKIGFRFEPPYYTGNKDGTFFLISIIIGLATFMYAFFSLKFRKCSNKKEKVPNESLKRDTAKDRRAP